MENYVVAFHFSTCPFYGTLFSQEYRFVFRIHELFKICTFPDASSTRMLPYAVLSYAGVGIFALISKVKFAWVGYGRYERVWPRILLIITPYNLEYLPVIILMVQFYVMR